MKSKLGKIICLVWLLVIYPVCAAAHGDLHSQIAAVTLLIKKDPNNAKLYLKRGELYRQHQDWEEALSDFNRAEKLNPELEEVLYARGRMFFESGQFELAKKELDKFLSSKHTHIEALITRARTLTRLKESQSAIDDFTNAINLSEKPSPDLFVERAKADPSTDNAIKGLDEGIVQLGEIVTLEMFAIELELKRKGWDNALLRIERISKQFPRKEKLLFKRGGILLLADRKVEALTSFQSSLKEIESMPNRLRMLENTVQLEKAVRAEIEKLKANSSDDKKIF